MPVVMAPWRCAVIRGLEALPGHDAQRGDVGTVGLVAGERRHEREHPREDVEEGGRSAHRGRHRSGPGRASAAAPGPDPETAGERLDAACVLERSDFGMSASSNSCVRRRTIASVVGERKTPRIPRGTSPSHAGPATRKLAPGRAVGARRHVAEDVRVEVDEHRGHVASGLE